MDWRRRKRSQPGYRGTCRYMHGRFVGCCITLHDIAKRSREENALNSCLSFPAMHASILVDLAEELDKRGVRRQQRVRSRPFLHHCLATYDWNDADRPDGWPFSLRPRASSAWEAKTSRPPASFACPIWDRVSRCIGSILAGRGPAGRDPSRHSREQNTAQRISGGLRSEIIWRLRHSIPLTVSPRRRWSVLGRLAGENSICFSRPRLCHQFGPSNSAPLVVIPRRRVWAMDWVRFPAFTSCLTPPPGTRE